MPSCCILPREHGKEEAKMDKETFEGKIHEAYEQSVGPLRETDDRRLEEVFSQNKKQLEKIEKTGFVVDATACLRLGTMQAASDLMLSRPTIKVQATNERREYVVRATQKYENLIPDVPSMGFSIS